MAAESIDGGDFDTSLEAVAHQDPIERLRRQLHESQLLDDEDDDQIPRDCISVVEAALEQARSSPMAEPAAALENVYGAPP